MANLINTLAMNVNYDRKLALESGQFYWNYGVIYDCKAFIFSKKSSRMRTHKITNKN